MKERKNSQETVLEKDGEKNQKNQKPKAEKIITNILIKIEMQHIKDAKGFGVGFDTGVLFTFFKDLKAGILVQDIGDRRMKWDYNENGIAKHSSEMITSRLKAGLSYDFKRLFGEEKIGNAETKTNKKEGRAGCTRGHPTDFGLPSPGRHGEAPLI